MNRSHMVIKVEKDVHSYLTFLKCIENDKNLSDTMRRVLEEHETIKKCFLNIDVEEGVSQ